MPMNITTMDSMPLSKTPMRTKCHWPKRQFSFSAWYLLNQHKLIVSQHFHKLISTPHFAEWYVLSLFDQNRAGVVPPISQITPKIKKLKSMAPGNKWTRQILSRNFRLLIHYAFAGFFARGNFYPANSSGSKFWQYALDF